MFKATMIAGAGGFFGAILRFLSDKLGAILCAGAFPLGTFIANMCGCLLIGIFYGWATKTQLLSKGMNVFLITGLCGGFTTFSSFSDDMISLLQKGDDITFWLYMIGSLLFGLGMVALGIAAVRPQKKAQATNQLIKLQKSMFTAMIVAGLGGFVGSGCRYLTGVAAKKICGTSYPFGTFAANVIGCFIIGLFFGLWDRSEMSPLMNALLISGFCGGYTTFSSFSHDTYKMIVNGEWGKFLLYVIPSVGLGLLMVWLGMLCTGR